MKPSSHDTFCQITRQKFLPESVLRSLPPKRLLGVLQKARAIESAISRNVGPRCCEMCHEYIGDDWEKEVGQFLRPWTQYKNLIKRILSNHPHIPRRRTTPKRSKHETYTRHRRSSPCQIG